MLNRKDKHVGCRSQRLPITAAIQRIPATPKTASRHASSRLHLLPKCYAEWPSKVLAKRLRILKTQARNKERNASAAVQWMLELGLAEALVSDAFSMTPILLTTMHANIGAAGCGLHTVSGA